MVVGGKVFGEGKIGLEIVRLSVEIVRWPQLGSNVCISSAGLHLS